MNYVKSLAKQLGSKGIRVNGVAPGPIWTALQVSGGAQPEKQQMFGSWTMLGRPGQPAELASIYVQLAAADASFASGQVYGSSGGVGQLNTEMMRKICFIILASLTCQVAVAQIPQPDPDTTTQHFLIVASIKNLQEVGAGQLAVQQAKNAEVRSFGQMMVTDHGHAEQELLQLAKRKNISMPPVASSGIQPDPMLRNAGPKFDQLFVHAMLPGHENAVQVFQNYAITGKYSDVRAFARKILPMLRLHLEHIKIIEKEVK